MASTIQKRRQLRDIADKSQFWDVEDLMSNFDREMALLEQGLGHMIWDRDEHRVTTFIRPLPVTPSFRISEDDKEFTLSVKLPNVSKDDIRLKVDKNSVDILACSGDLVCRPYYVSVVTKGELAPETAKARLEDEEFEIKVSKTRKKRLEVK